MYDALASENYRKYIRSLPYVEDRSEEAIRAADIVDAYIDQWQEER